MISTENESNGTVEAFITAAAKAAHERREPAAEAKAEGDK